jgi:hypothetical protein
MFTHGECSLITFIIRQKMIKKIAWNWETLDECTQRAKVIGGWLVLRLGATDFEKGKRVQFRESMVFIADRDHEWIVTAPFNPSQAAKLQPVVNANDFESPK